MSYLDSHNIPVLPSYPASDYSYVVFETNQANSAEDYLEQSLSVPASRRVKVNRTALEDQKICLAL